MISSVCVPHIVSTLPTAGCGRLEDEILFGGKKSYPNVYCSVTFWETEWKIPFGTPLPQMACQCLSQLEILIRSEVQRNRKHGNLDPY